MDKKNYYRRLDAAIRFIEDHLDEPISMSDISQQAFSSLSHFHRIFSGMTGMSLKEYIRARRLTKATQMLVSTDIKVLDIALMLQFSTHEGFSRAFRNAFGKSPSEFRKNPGSYPVQSLIDVYRDYATTPQSPPGIIFKVIQLEGFTVAGQSIKTTLANQQQTRDIPNFVQASLQEKLSNDAPVQETYGVYTDMCDDEEFTFLFGNRVDVESGVCGEPIDIPEGLYACFSVAGGPEQIGKAWAYIYGKWMPHSGRARRNGFDFEIYYPKKTDIYIPICDDDTKSQEDKLGIS